MSNILIIDNNRESQREYTTALGPQYNYKLVDNLADTSYALSNFAYDTILLDLDLSHESGFDILKRRERFSLNQETPIIVVTRRDATSDKVHAFSLGADDYIVKPFDVLEFRARIESKIVKKLKKKNSLQMDGLHIEPHFQKVFKKDNDKKKDLQLTPIEFKILFALIESKGRPLSRDSLVEKVWDKDHSFESRGIDAHVSNLRKKLGAQSKIVGSVYGVGYVYRPISSIF